VLSVDPQKIVRETGSSEEERENLKDKKEPELTQTQVDKLKNISAQICSGSNVFLFSEYFYLVIFILLFGALIFKVAEEKPGTFYTTIAFVVGAFTSILCGYIGMMIATSANYRTAYKA
jgi:inorganic pyrophosphatase